VGTQVIPKIEFVPIPRESHVKMNGLASETLRGISFHEHEVRGWVIRLHVANISRRDQGCGERRDVRVSGDFQ